MTPNTETTYLLTQRIIDDLIPKYIETRRIIDLDINSYDTHLHKLLNDIDTNISIHFKIDDNKFECSFYKKSDRLVEVPIDAQRLAELTAERERQRFMLGGDDYARRGVFIHAGIGGLGLHQTETRREQIEEITKNFNSKSTAIDFISKHVDTSFLIDVGLNLIGTLERLEQLDTKHVGAIKKILGLNPDADLTSVQTRKILLEIYR